MQIHRAWPSSARSSSLIKYSSMKPCWYALRPCRPLPHDFLSWSILRGLAAFDSSNLPVLEQGWETWRLLVLDQWSHVISRQTCGLEILTSSKPESPVFGLGADLHVQSSAIDSVRHFPRSFCLLVWSPDHTEAPVNRVVLKHCQLGGWRPESPLFGLDVHLRLQSSIPHDVSFKTYRLLAWCCRSSMDLVPTTLELYVPHCAQYLCPPHGLVVIAVLVIPCASILHLRLSIRHAGSVKFASLQYHGWLAWCLAIEPWPGPASLSIMW